MSPALSVAAALKLRLIVLASKLEREKDITGRSGVEEHTFGRVALQILENALVPLRHFSGSGGDTNSNLYIRGRLKSSVTEGESERSSGNGENRKKSTGPSPLRARRPSL